MKYIHIKTFYANTSGLEDCKRYVAKYSKARKINNMLNISEYIADINIKAGPHVQIDNLLKWSDGNMQYSMIEKPSRNKRGTLKAILQYVSKPAKLGHALIDLSKLYEDTAIYFGSNWNAIVDTAIFTGKWDISLSSREPWSESKINMMLESQDSDVTNIKLQFVGLLDDTEIKSLSSIVDELYLPDYTGYKLIKEFDETYINSEYTTKIPHHEIKSNMPKVVVQKRMYGFDETKILEFCNKVKSFEKTDFWRHHKFADWPRPIMNVEVASIADGKKIYANYMNIDDIGSEYYNVARNNRKKDLVKGTKNYAF